MYDGFFKLYDNYFDLHRSLGHRHVQIAEHVVGLRFAAVVFEGMPHGDRLLFAAPHRSAVVNVDRHAGVAAATIERGWKKMRN